MLYVGIDWFKDTEAVFLILTLYNSLAIENDVFFKSEAALNCRERLLVKRWS